MPKDVTAPLAAQWIWSNRDTVYEYNQTVLFRKEFELNRADAAFLKITADSWYRVSINGKWVNDGPAKAYPDHYLYDIYDVGNLLRFGRNKIEIICRYFGVGTFRQISTQAGVWAQLDAGGEVEICTDESWQASVSQAWKQRVPKVSSQMEPVEEYDARRRQELEWKPVVVVRRSGRLSPRPVGALTKKLRRFKSPIQSVMVKRAEPQTVVPVARIAHPGIIEANRYTSRPVLLFSMLTVLKKQQFDFLRDIQNKDYRNKGVVHWQVSIAGRILKTGRRTLAPGKYPVLFACTEFFGMKKELPFPDLNRSGCRWDPWQVAVLEDYLFRGDDRQWVCFKNEKAERVKTGYLEKIQELAVVCKTERDLQEQMHRYVRPMPADQFLLNDFAAEFAGRIPVASADRQIDGRMVYPSKKGDVELCFDLGEQSCGYFEFDVKAAAGEVLDFNMVEYMTPDGEVQHTMPFNRNGMRYITKKGVNRFTSLKRRAGRYLFLTLKNHKSPVEIRSLQIIEATAPVEPVSSFACSDPVLNKLWKMSERTLRLCMEDTFTDCPLYEQTLWTGDARNEALYAFAVYGNFDVSARGLELGAQSLCRFPIVGCQVPSSWDCILPAWSFLWGIHVWEHYFYSGDRRLLRKLWPAVLKNIDGALAMLNENGLFSGRFWNLFEWAPIDQDHETVLHNSLLFAGALRAAEKCSVVLKDDVQKKRLARVRAKLVAKIRRTWDDAKASFPDSIHENGSPSPKTCQHTSMLAVMCGVVPPGRTAAVRRNLMDPPPEMTVAGTPFATQFLYEALEELGEMDAVLSSMTSCFSPMVETDSSTVWEMFPGSDFDTNGFPSRSHCHAWSSSPIYFLNRIVLGIRQTEVKGRAFEISPWLGELLYAKGAAASASGPVSVEWKRQRKRLQVAVHAPAGIRIDFKSNASHNGLVTEVVIRRTRNA